jgi:hypothetical protein
MGEVQFIKGGKGIFGLDLLFLRGSGKRPVRPIMPLLPGRRSLPLLAEVLTLLRGQILEPPGPAPDPFLLLGGKTPEVMVSFTDKVSFLGRKLLPSLEPLLRLFPFLRSHVLPSFRSPAEALLPFGRQLIPPLFIGPQDLLFLRSEPIPRAGESFAAGDHGEKDHPQGQDHKVFIHLPLPPAFFSGSSPFKGYSPFPFGIFRISLLPSQP